MSAEHRGSKDRDSRVRRCRERRRKVEGVAAQELPASEAVSEENLNRAWNRVLVMFLEDVRDVADMSCVHVVC